MLAINITSIDTIRSNKQSFPKFHFMIDVSDQALLVTSDRNL